MPRAKRAAKRAAPRGRRISRDLPTVELTLPVQVADRSLVMRMDAATGKATHEGVEYELEVWMSMNGAAVGVTVTPKDSGFWRHYALTSESLMRAAFDYYLAHPPTAEERG